MSEICTYCGEDTGHEPDCPETIIAAMQEEIDSLTEQLESLRQQFAIAYEALDDIAGGDDFSPMNGEMDIARDAWVKLTDPRPV